MFPQSSETAAYYRVHLSPEDLRDILTGRVWYLLNLPSIFPFFQGSDSFLVYPPYFSCSSNARLLHLLPTFQLGCLCFLMLSCMSCLYTLDISPLSVIFLQVVSFAVKNLCSLIRSHLFIFASVSFALEDRAKKVLL